MALSLISHGLALSLPILCALHSGPIFFFLAIVLFTLFLASLYGGRLLFICHIPHFDCAHFLMYRHLALLWTAQLFFATWTCVRSRRLVSRGRQLRIRFLLYYLVRFNSILSEAFLQLGRFVQKSSFEDTIKDKQPLRIHQLVEKRLCSLSAAVAFLQRRALHYIVLDFIITPLCSSLS